MNFPTHKLSDSSGSEGSTHELLSLVQEVRKLNVERDGGIGDSELGIESSKHNRLDLNRLDIVYKTRIRVAGCDMEGNPLNEEGIQRDIDTIALLHGTHVVTPEDVKSQIDKLKTAITEAGNDHLELKPEDFEFLKLGGHTPTNLLPAVLSEIVRGQLHGYALLGEWVDDDWCIPIAYNFGFTEMPDEDPRFPNFDPTDIAGQGKGFIEEHADEIMVSWRVGTLHELTKSVREKMLSIGINIPENLIGITFTRLGVNNKIKAVCARAAEIINRKGMTYNTAVLCVPSSDDLVLTEGLMNEPLRRSNQGLFRSAGIRNRQDAIKMPDGTVVAKVVWEAFINSPQSVLKAVFREGGVLFGKGGSDKDVVRGYGDTFGKVLKNRNKI